MMLQAPELTLSDDEAEKLAMAISRVERHFPAKIPPWMKDVGALGAVAAAIYKPKIVAMMYRAASDAAVPAEVYPPGMTPQ